MALWRGLCAGVVAVAEGAGIQQSKAQFLQDPAIIGQTIVAPIHGDAKEIVLGVNNEFSLGSRLLRQLSNIIFSVGHNIFHCCLSKQTRTLR